MKLLKKTFLIHLSLFLLCSCGNKDRQPGGEDSLPAVEEEPQVNYEDEDKVIADLKFFVSKKDYDKNQCKYLASIKHEKLNDYMIGNYMAMASPKTAFENDSLYYLEFRGQPYQSKDFEGDLAHQYKDLFDLYKSKYGYPSFKVSSFPKSYEMREGYYQELARWDLGKRTISIRLSEWVGMYCINLSIYRNDIMQGINYKKHRETDKKRKSAYSEI